MTHNSELEKLSKNSRAGLREWTGLAVLALPCLLYSMDLTVLNLAVPVLSRELMPSSTQLLWIVDIYGFLLAGLLIPMGTLGDRIGRRKLLLIGAALFGAASVLAALSSSAAELIGACAVLGIAGATLAPSTLSLIRQMFLDARQRTFAIGVWITSFSAGAAIGPLVGGALLESFGWQSAFLDPARSADRSSALPDTGLQRGTGHERARLLCQLRCPLVLRPISAARARTLAVARRALDAADIRRLHCRLACRAGHRAACSACLRDDQRPRPRGWRIPRARPRRGRWTRYAGRWISFVLVGSRARVHAGHRHDGGHRAAGTRGSGCGRVGNQL
jgi:nitrate/nitrite transporter NarK